MHRIKLIRLFMLCRSSQMLVFSTCLRCTGTQLFPPYHIRGLETRSNLYNSKMVKSNLNMCILWFLHVSIFCSHLSNWICLFQSAKSNIQSKLFWQFSESKHRIYSRAIAIFIWPFYLPRHLISFGSMSTGYVWLKLSSIPCIYSKSSTINSSRSLFNNIKVSSQIWTKAKNKSE